MKSICIIILMGQVLIQATVNRKKCRMMLKSIQGDQTIERRTFPISSTLEKREKDVKRLLLLSKECYFP